MVNSDFVCFLYQKIHQLVPNMALVMPSYLCLSPKAIRVQGDANVNGDDLSEVGGDGDSNRDGDDDDDKSIKIQRYRLQFFSGEGMVMAWGAWR